MEFSVLIYYIGMIYDILAPKIYWYIIYQFRIYQYKAYTSAQ